MNSHQVSVAAESFAASIFAQAGFDVLVQYGANQPDYDLVAVSKNFVSKVSVKGSQDGGWALAVSKKKKGQNVSYFTAIDLWRTCQKDDIIFCFVQYWRISIGNAPRVYLATVKEVAARLKEQWNGRGHLALFEDYRAIHPKSGFNDQIPSHWKFSKERLEEVISLVSKTIK